jgi:uncharacterized protein YndB with AHSA1/START domain
VIATRTRTVQAAPDVVWTVVGDPAALVRWWPMIERVEGVTAGAWTTVHRSARGRSVRADWRLEESEPPLRRAWAQELEGTPFARILAERRVEARIEPAGAATTVTLALRQRGRGWARFGSLMLRGAARKELNAALDGLERALP